MLQPAAFLYNMILYSIELKQQPLTQASSLIKGIDCHCNLLQMCFSSKPCKCQVDLAECF